MADCLRVKICGVSSPQTAAFAAAAGADAIGIVFFAGSSRNVGDLRRAQDIAMAAGPFVSVVGLFVNPEPAEVERVLHEVPLGLLQFHGQESNELCRSFGRPFIKALRMKPGLDVQGEIARYPAACGILLDAYRAGVPGGTGDTFDWSLIPSQLSKPLVLAGGLSCNNVAEAVGQIRPWAVDVSGGVESAPGVKSHQLVNEFIQQAKQAAGKDRGNAL